MSTFLGFLAANREGLLVLFTCLFVLALLIHWISWVFGWGRFRRRNGVTQDLTYIYADALVKIINDFRHLLALIIVLIFASVLWYVIVASNGSPADLKDGIQMVVACLGGLVGSIIGYYFGESAVTKAQGRGEPSTPSGGGPPVQDQAGAPAAGDPPIEAVPPPPGSGEP